MIFENLNSRSACIYIDPPYNTGNEGWIYNDSVNSPEIRKWLGRVVGGEMEDLSRHDKWLCMIYPRLSLLREMLREVISPSLLPPFSL
jgi:adenine specific DNA methylase Mod